MTTPSNCSQQAGCLPRLIRLQNAHKATAKALIAAVKEEYPVGGLIEVTLGRATIRAEVMSHNEYWWHRPGEMTVRNIITDKLRTVNPLSTSQGPILLSEPNAQVEARGK